MSIGRCTGRLVLPVLGVALASVTLGAGRQVSPLDVADAKGFINDWIVTAETVQGSVEWSLVVTEADGKIVATLAGGPRDLAPFPITDIVKSGDHLVLRYEAYGQDGRIPATMTLEPVDRFNLNVVIETADGQFRVEGKAILDCHCA